jgi:hypothetical protein
MENEALIGSGSRGRRQRIPHHAADARWTVVPDGLADFSGGGSQRLVCENRCWIELVVPQRRQMPFFFPLHL